MQVMQGDLIGMEHLPAYMCRRDHERRRRRVPPWMKRRDAGLLQRVADEEATEEWTKRTPARWR